MRARSRAGRALATLLVLAAFAGAAFAAEPSAQPAAKPASNAVPLHVVILETNDLHGTARSIPAVWIDRDKPPMAGGFPALSAHIKKIRAEEAARGVRVLVVDCGDFFQGTPEGDMSHGELVIDVMNEIGYDALEVGNHDFDQGPAVTEALAKRARFPFLGANVHRAGTKALPSWLKESVDFPELHLQLVGILSSQMPSLTVPRARVGLEFEREEDFLERFVWKKNRARVAVTHLGLDRDREIARSGKFDALIGAHSHSRASEKVGNVPILQAGEKGTNIGRLDLWIDPATGRVVDSKTTIEPIAPAAGEDPKVTAIIAKYAPEIDKTMDVVLGELAHDLKRDIFGRSSPLGNLLCDLMREATGAEIAIHNRTAIRRSLPKGKIRLRDVYEVSPFRNSLVTMKLSGREITELVETDILGERFRTEVSGISIEYDLDAKKLSIATADGKPLDPEREYKVVTNSHLAGGGSGFKLFTTGRDTLDTGLDLIDLQRADFEKHSPRSYDAPDRVRPKPGTRVPVRTDRSPATTAAPAAAPKPDRS